MATTSPASNFTSPGTIREFIDAARYIGESGLARCSSGNLSLRIDEDLILISASRSWLRTLTEGQISVCRISTGEAVAGNRPSVETGMHTGILRERPGKNVVLHFQSPGATAFCCRPGPTDFNIIPEVPYYLGPIGWVPYRLPGSPELAEAATGVMKEHDLCLLQNHGLITVADDLKHAIQNAEFFELACDVLHKNGDRARLLEPGEVEELMSLGVSGSGGA